jgi:hypothetical protein
MLVASAFYLDNGADPVRRDGKAIGRFRDEFGDPVDGFKTRRGLCERARLERRARDHGNERRDPYHDERDRSR